jgi:fructokinase
MAGLLAGLAGRGDDPSSACWQAIIRQAMCCGALATTEKGAMTALPDTHALAAFSRQAFL